MTRPPNILIVVIDSMRADHVSCYGYPRRTTSHLDRLAAEGCLFENAISAAPFSPASYASLMSNLYPHQHGVNGDTVRVWPGHFTRLAEKMKTAGYTTFGISSNDFVSTRCNAAGGFDRFADVFEGGWTSRQIQRVIGRVRRHFGERWARRLEINAVQCAAKGDSRRSADLACSWIDEVSEPFFGFVVMMDPHAPFRRTRQTFMTEPDHRPSFFRTFNEGAMWVGCMARRQPPPHEWFRVAIDAYDSEIVYADRCLGVIVEHLRRAGRLDDTIVAVAADHGEAFGERGVWGHGFSLHDCLSRVPLVVRCPRYWPAGLRPPGLVQFHDLHPTCLHVAGATADQAETSLTAAGNPGWSGRAHAFSEFPVQTGTLSLMKKMNPSLDPGRWAEPMWSIRATDWLYIEYGDRERELFDLRRDPGQTRSVLNDHAAVADELAERLAAHREDRAYAPATGEGDESVDEVVLERLRALGYIE